MNASTTVRRYGSSIRRMLKGTIPGGPPRAGGLFPDEATIPLPELALRSSVGPAAAFHDIPLLTMGRMNMAGLRPDHSVLDVGCGVGRTARYLCDYLDPDSRYEGFDIQEEAVRWCQANITPRFPNFRFTFVPLFNTQYNADPSLPRAGEFRFPYPDASFDFGFAHSVFTHLLPEVTTNYLNEISRVLSPNGTCYSTWFLYDDGPSAYSHPLTTKMHRDPSGTYAVRNTENPDAAVAYEEEFVRNAYRSSGLSIVEPIRPGFARLQDAIVAVKEPIASSA